MNMLFGIKHLYYYLIKYICIFLHYKMWHHKILLDLILQTQLSLLSAFFEEKIYCSLEIILKKYYRNILVEMCLIFILLNQIMNLVFITRLINLNNIISLIIDYWVLWGHHRMQFMSVFIIFMNFVLINSAQLKIHNNYFAN